MILFVLSLAGMAALVSARSADPLILLIARDLTVPVTTAALLATAYSLPLALAQPILGPLGDVFGKGRMLKVCLWMLASALAFCALAPSFEMLFGSRLVAGVVAGGIYPAAMAIIGDRFATEHRQVAISRFVMVGLLGQIFATGAAGMIAMEVGWRSVFGIVAFLALVAAISASMTIRDPVSKTSGEFSPGRVFGKYKEVFANSKAFLCFGTVFLEGAALFGVLPYVAGILESKGAGGTREAGFIVGAIGFGGLAYTLVLPLLLRYLKRTTLMAIGGGVATLGLWGLNGDFHWSVITALFGATGFGYMMLHNSIQTEVIGLAPNARTSASSMHAFSFFAGQAVGPILFALGFHAIGVVPAVVIASLALGVTGCVVSWQFVRIGNGIAGGAKDASKTP